MARGYMIQVYDKEAVEMLQGLVAEDLRSYGNEVSWLIRQEYNRRFSFNTEDSTAVNDQKQPATKAQ